MRRFLLITCIFFNFLANAQTTNSYTSATTWTVPAGVTSISLKVWGGAGGTGGQDCGAGCSNPAASNVGYVVASFVVTPGNVVGIYPGGQAVNGTSASTSSGGGAGGVASYNTNYNGGKGGNAGPVGSSGGGGGGGAATVVTIASVIKVVAGGAGGGGGMANLAVSGSPGSVIYVANGTSNKGGDGTAPTGDGGGGGGGGGGNFGGVGGSTHVAGPEQAGDGGAIGNNLISGANTTTFNTNISWTSGGRIDITFNVTAPVTWVDFKAVRQPNNNILLNWITATELNTRSFSVQRSTNGNDWSTIGEVAAAGNSVSNSTYQFLDKEVVRNTYYYRLLQVDLNGQTAFSKTVVCTATGSKVRLYPNPVNAQTILTLSDASLITVYNSKGQILVNRQMPAGDNKLDLSKYAPGVYFLQAGTEKISFVIK